MAAHPADKQARANIRTGVAFWLASDRHSVTEGPQWLWRGDFAAPLRSWDLPDTTATKITRRRHTLPAALAEDPTVTERALRTPWATARSAAGWALAALAATAVAMISTSMSGDRVGLAAISLWAAGGAALIFATICLALAWARSDPTRLDSADAAAIGAATRRLHWNPLAGSGKITRGGAYTMEGVQAIEAIDEHPAWALPATESLHSRFDADEELFQIARGALRLDQTAADAAAEQEHHLLESALLQRLVALRIFEHRLDGLYEHAQQVMSAAAGNVLSEDGCVAVVENELAAETLAGFSAEVTALRAGYDELRSSSVGRAGVVENR